MKTCGCVLNITDPSACKVCPNGVTYLQQYVNDYNSAIKQSLYVPDTINDSSEFIKWVKDNAPS